MKNRVLRKTFGPRGNEITGNGENYILWSIMINNPHQILFVWPNPEE